MLQRDDGPDNAPEHQSILCLLIRAMFVFSNFYRKCPDSLLYEHQWAIGLSLVHAVIFFGSSNMIDWISLNISPSLIV